MVYFQNIIYALFSEMYSHFINWNVVLQVKKEHDIYMYAVQDY